MKTPSSAVLLFLSLIIFGAAQNPSRQELNNALILSKHGLGNLQMHLLTGNAAGNRTSTKHGAMKQQTRTIPGKLVDFDYSRYRLPTFVMQFKPCVYQDGDCYYAVLSFEEENDLSGLGTTPEDALIDWNDKVCEMLALSGPLRAALEEKNK